MDIIYRPFDSLFDELNPQVPCLSPFRIILYELVIQKNSGLAGGVTGWWCQRTIVGLHAGFLLLPFLLLWFPAPVFQLVFFRFSLGPFPKLPGVEAFI